MLHPDLNPVGLGLLAWAGSLVRITVAVIGLLLWAIRLAGDARSG